MRHNSLMLPLVVVGGLLLLASLHALLGWLWVVLIPPAVVGAYCLSTRGSSEREKQRARRAARIAVRARRHPFHPR